MSWYDMHTAPPHILPFQTYIYMVQPHLRTCRFHMVLVLESLISFNFLSSLDWDIWTDGWISYSLIFCLACVTSTHCGSTLENYVLQEREAVHSQSLLSSLLTVFANIHNSYPYLAAGNQFMLRVALLVNTYQYWDLVFVVWAVTYSIIQYLVAHVCPHQSPTCHLLYIPSTCYNKPCKTYLWHQAFCAPVIITVLTVQVATVKPACTQWPKW